MEERTGIITLRGRPLTLIGHEVRVGDKAPDFEVLNNELETVRFSSVHGKVSILSSVPSLDTPVCDMETRRFDQELGRLGFPVEMWTISMDLPFAQKRWCGATGTSRIRTLSDHREASFGMAYGVLIKELRLLARALFVVDREGTIQYIELVREVSSEPDYEAVWKALQKAT